MEITKLRLLKLKNGNGLELSYDKLGPNGDKIAVNGETHSAIIHNDLYGWVQSLAPHLAMMAFHVKETEVEPTAIADPAKFKDFAVGSYSISGKDEKRGIIISGTLRKNGKAHNFNTPFYRFEEPESGRYGFMDDVENTLRAIEGEVNAYLNGTKRGEPAQPEIGPGGEPVTKMQIASPVEKVTEEGNLAPGSAKYKYADTDAMGRVAEIDQPKGKGGKKKVRQTAEAPSGEVDE
jgi:hypothetical protein